MTFGFGCSLLMGFFTFRSLFILIPIPIRNVFGKLLISMAIQLKRLYKHTSDRIFFQLIFDPAQLLAVGLIPFRTSYFRIKIKNFRNTIQFDKLLTHFSFIHLQLDRLLIYLFSTESIYSELKTLKTNNRKPFFQYSKRKIKI